MPLKLNIGLARKVGESNYGSRGASVNVELEVDSSLVSEPDKLKERIRALFGLVRASLAEELNGGSNGNANGNANGNGHGPNTQEKENGQHPNGGQRKDAPRAATQSQVKAIYAIARSQKLDLKRLLSDRFRIDRPESLNIRDANAFIDELKSN